MKASGVSNFVAVPRDYVTNPIFAAKPTTQSRTVYLSDGTRYTIGGNLLDTGKPAPALDVRHLRLLLVLLFFRQKDFPPPTRITFSMNEACHQYASSQGGRYSRELLNLFEDLKNSCFEIQRAGSKDFFIYPILKDFRIRGKYRRRKLLSDQLQKELHLEYAELHEDFIPILMETVHFDLSTFKSITSPIAQAIYAFIPARAANRSRKSAFSIALTTILRQIGMPVPSAKWERKKIFTQNKNSILAQLSGALTRTGILQAELTETVDCRDYKLLFWEEKFSTPPEKLPVSKTKKQDLFCELWLKSGGSEEELHERIMTPFKLTPKEESLIKSSKVKLHGNKKVFALAKTLIGPDTFLACLRTLDESEQVITTSRTQTSRFFFSLKEAIARAAKSHANS